MKTIRTESCGSCGSDVWAHDSVHTNGEEGPEILCCRCFNERAAEQMGLDFVHPTFESMTLADRRGAGHEFHFRTQFVPSGLLVEAFELKGRGRGGYEFAVLGSFEDEPMELIGELLGRMRRALARKHLEEGEHGRQIGPEQTVRGRIVWDDGSDGRLPLLVVDGEEITWDELGRMLMTFEGFQFRLEVRDRTDEV